ncbi:MAG: FMN reductase [Azospirillaceae bacterium]|nr:FMN reductase [Azospirillaceae bacterium]
MSALKLTALSGNLKGPSRTHSLVAAVVAAIAERIPVDRTDIVVGDLAPELGGLVDPAHIPPRVQAAIDAIVGADLLVVGSPVYKGSYTGLFKHLIDFIDPNALIGLPVVLTATGGSLRHALVIEHQLRPLFGFFLAQTVPTGVFALDSDFTAYQLTSPDIQSRVHTTAEEAVRIAVPGRARRATAVAA